LIRHESRNPSFEAQQFVRVRRGDAVRRLIQRDKTPLAVLLMAAVVGTLAGLVGVAFEKSVNWVQNSASARWRRWRITGIWSGRWRLSCRRCWRWWAIFWCVALRRRPGIRDPGNRRGAGGAASGALVARAAGEIYRRHGDAGRRDGAGSRRADGAAWRQRRAHGAGYFPHAQSEARHTLLATGAAAGLSAAFNAPLAGILFIIEEMRPQFRYNLISIKAVFTGVIMSSIVFRILMAKRRSLRWVKLSNAPVNTLWLYLILGMIFGCVGPLFNSLVLRTRICSSVFTAAIQKMGADGRVNRRDVRRARADSAGGGRWL
jgi:CIC family chloride channel protein